MKDKKKRILTISIIIIISIVFSSIATVAWFVYNSRASLTSSDIGIKVDSGDLLISADDGLHWGNEIDITTDATTYTIDISGDGKTFIYPKSLDENDQPIISSPSSFLDVTTENKDGFFISIDLLFKTSSKMDVYLGNDSYVDGVEQYLFNSQASYARRSLYGDFSCDAIAGAARISFIDMTDENDPELKCVWAPNDKYELKLNDVGGENNNNTFTDDGVRESTLGYKYLYKTNEGIEQHDYTTDDYVSGSFAINKNIFAAYSNNTMSINHSVPLLSFTETGSWQTKKMRINIWIEGTDREANKALNGGCVKYVLSFLGIYKDDQNYTLSTDDGEIPENVRKIFYDTSDKKLKYSTNSSSGLSWVNGALEYTTDGYTWQAYNNLVIQMTAESKTLYCRAKETTTKKPTNIVKVIIPANNP